MQGSETLNRDDLRDALQTIYQLRSRPTLGTDQLEKAMKRIATKILGHADGIMISALPGVGRVVRLNDERKFQMNLGSGVSKTVISALFIDPQGGVHPVALAIIQLDTKEAIDDTAQELKIARLIQERLPNAKHHRFVLPIADWNVDSTHYIISPLQTEGTLDDWLKQMPSLEERLERAIKIAKAVMLLHRAKIFHSDLRTVNIMKERLLDFGFSIDLQDPDSTYRGSHRDATPHEIRRRASGSILRASGEKLPGSKEQPPLEKLEQLRKTNPAEWLKFQTKFRRYPILYDQPSMYYASDVWAFGQILEEMFPDRWGELNTLITEMCQKDWNERPRIRSVFERLKEFLEEVQLDQAHESYTPPESSEESNSHDEEFNAPPKPTIDDAVTLEDYVTVFND